MSEPALRQAVLAAPDDDLPRLVYADWLDDTGDSARAEFIRHQIRLASTPAWELFAVHARHHQPDLITGRQWLDALPHLGDGRVVNWHDAQLFHRGFGWAVRIRQLSAFLARAAELFALEPIGELVLPAATRDDWEELAQCPWLANIQRLRFTTASMLSEPIRALAASPFATKIRSIAFEVSTSPGMGAVVELLMQSPLAKQLKELEFRVGHDRDGEVLEELSRAEGLCLERLTLATMGQSSEAFQRLAELPNVGKLKSLTVEHQPASGAVAAALRSGLRSFALQQVMVLAGQLTGRDVRGFAERTIDSIQSLNLSENVFGEEGLTAICEQARFAGLRSLQLSRCGLDDSCIEPLMKASFWPNLVELDLRGNRFTNDGLQRFLEATPPKDLAAIVLSDMEFADETRMLIREHYGSRAIV